VARLRAQPQLRQQLECAAFRQAQRIMVELLAQQQRQHHVLQRRHDGNERVGLEHMAYELQAQVRARLFRQFRHQQLLENDAAFAGQFQHADHIEQARFAAPARPANGDNLAPLYLQENIVQGVDAGHRAAIYLVHALQAQ
jgi:hypothetical protein